MGDKGWTNNEGQHNRNNPQTNLKKILYALVEIVYTTTLFILFNVAPQIVLLHETWNHAKSIFVANCCDYSFVKGITKLISNILR